MEIAWKGDWSSICGSSFAMKEANVVCKELGYGKPLELNYNSVDFSVKKWLSNITCEGSAASLFQCNRGRLDYENCNVKQYPQIKCSLQGNVQWNTS